MRWLTAWLLAALALAGACGGRSALDLGEADAEAPLTEVRVRALGLHLDPNAYELPPGALRVADNVHFRRHGVAEPRHGFDSGTVPGASGRFLKTILWGTQRIMATDAPQLRRVLTSPGEVLDENGQSITWDDPSKIQRAFAANNLYITSATGVRRMDSPTATVAPLAGVPGPGAVHVELQTSGGWLANDEAVAYRALLMREVNGRQLRSAPSGRYGVISDGAARLPVVRIPLPDDAAAGDHLELYRTRTFASASTAFDSGDEMRMAASRVVAAADITAGYMEIEDHTSNDNALGAALYTNATQQGILQGNYRPPKADDVALHQRMLFYGRTFRPHSVVVEASADAALDTMGSFSPSGDFTNGSPTVTNVNSFMGLAVGQTVSETWPDEGTLIPSGTTIVALDPGASTVTMSANATASVTTQIFVAYDWISVDGQKYWISLATHDPARRIFIATKQDGVFIAHAMGSFAGVFSENPPPGRDMYAEYIGDAQRPGAVRITATDGTGFAIRATKGTDWQPELAHDDDLLESQAEDRPHRLYFSKPDEPEAVPLGNWVEIGAETKPILRLIPLRDSLLVFKTDGIFRVTGRTPRQLAVDPLNVDARLVHRDAVAVLDDRVVAWTTMGIVVISDIAVTRIDTPIQNGLRSITTEMHRALELNENPNVRGAWVAVNVLDGEIMVGAPQAATSGRTQHIWVYNTRTDAWSRLIPPADAGIISAVVAETGLTLPRTPYVFFPGYRLSDSAGREFGMNTGGPAGDRAMDFATTATVSGASGANATVSGVAPVVGGALIQSGAVYVITDVSGSNVTLSRAGIVNGSAQYGSPYPVTVEWQPFHAGRPDLDKFWRECVLYFDAMEGVTTFDATFRDAERGQAVTVPIAADDPHTARNRQVRVHVPTDPSRTPALYAQVKVNQAGARWALGLVACSFEPMADRLATSP
jgi:hypothetical protein